MNQNVQDLFEFLKTPFPYFFIIASLAFSTLILNDADLFKSIYDKEAHIKEIAVAKGERVYVEGDETHFTIYCQRDFNPIKMISDFFTFVGTFLSIPAMLVTKTLIGGLRFDYPNWSPQTFETFAMLSLIYFNINFWLLLSYLISKTHDLWLQDRPQTKTFLSVVPK